MDLAVMNFQTLVPKVSRKPKFQTLVRSAYTHCIPGDLRRSSRFLFEEFRQKMYIRQWAAAVTFFVQNTHDMSRNAEIPCGQFNQLSIVGAFVGFL